MSCAQRSQQRIHIPQSRRDGALFGFRRQQERDGLDEEPVQVFLIARVASRLRIASYRLAREYKMYSRETPAPRDIAAHAWLVEAAKPSIATLPRVLP